MDTSSFGIPFSLVSAALKLTLPSRVGTDCHVCQCCLPLRSSPAVEDPSDDSGMDPYQEMAMNFEVGRRLGLFKTWNYDNYVALWILRPLASKSTIIRWRRKEIEYQMRNCPLTVRPLTVSFIAVKRGLLVNTPNLGGILSWSLLTM